MTGSSTLRAALFGLVATALAACAPPPGGGGFGRDGGGGAGPSTTPVRSVSEQREGDQAHSKIVARFGGAYREGPVQQYVERVGRQVAAVSEQPNERWTFTVLDSPVVNAFATPGGYIYVTRGLLALAENEAQVAGVLGHEIGHVTAGHGAARQERSAVAGLGVLLGAIGLSVLGADASLAQNALQLGQVVAGGVVASYSRNDELEADQLGIRYLARAGYDPFAEAEFIDNLSASAALDARTAGREYDPNRVDFLASHPANAQRVRQAIEVAQREGTIGRGGELGEDRHLANIDGMLWGQNPEQGFVRGTTFSHPVLGFTFEVPRGFRMTNMPSAVVADAQGGYRIVFDGAADPGGALDAYISGRWAGEIARQVRASRVTGLRRYSIGGNDAARGFMQVESDGRRLDVALVAVRFRGNLYRFTALAPAGARELDTMVRATDSFRALSAGERRELTARRIEIVTVRAGDSVETLGRRMAVDELPVERFRVLNGLGPRDTLRPGQRVKLVR